MATPALVEIHDATVAQVVLGVGGEARIEFSHVGVYELRQADQYDLVSYEALLAASGVEECACRGEFVLRNQVSTIRLDGRDLPSREVTAMATEPGQRLSGVLEVLFTSGTVLMLRARAMSLKLGKRGGVFDEWVGPL
jgi:hypothetical protein